MLLELRAVTKKFDGLTAVSNISFGVDSGEIVGVFGPNGSGKTTLLNLIVGMIVPTEGEIIWKGESIVQRRPFEIAQKGVVKSFQKPQLFSELTVLDHMRIATHLRLKRTLGVERILTLIGRKSDETLLDQFAPIIAGILQLCRLEEHADRQVASLSYGAEKMVGVAMALACEPNLLLLDEPTSGLSKEETKNLESVLLGLRDSGMTLCVIDHKVGFLSRIASKSIVLHHGALIASGDTAAVLADESVKAAYLGFADA